MFIYKYNRNNSVGKAFLIRININLKFLGIQDKHK